MNKTITTLVVAIGCILIVFVVLVTLLLQKKQLQSVSNTTNPIQATPVPQITVPAPAAGENIALEYKPTIIVKPTSIPVPTIISQEIRITVDGAYSNIRVPKGTTVIWNNEAGQKVSLEVVIGKNISNTISLESKERFGLPLAESGEVQYKISFADGTTKSSVITVE